MKITSYFAVQSQNALLPPIKKHSIKFAVIYLYFQSIPLLNFRMRRLRNTRRKITSSGHQQSKGKRKILRVQLEITREIMSSGRDVIITGTCYLCLLILILQEQKINTPVVLIPILYKVNWNNFSLWSLEDGWICEAQYCFIYFVLSFEIINIHGEHTEQDYKAKKNKFCILIIRWSSSKLLFR